MCMCHVLYCKALKLMEKPSISLLNKLNVCGIWSKMLKDKLQSWMLRFSSSQIMDATGIVYPHYWATIIQSYVKMTFPWYLEVLKGIYYTPCPSYEQPKNNNFFSYGSYHSFWVGSTWPLQVDNKLHVVQAIVEVVARHMI